MVVSQIDPEKMYTFREAARLIPSHRRADGVLPSTLYGWHRSGLLRAVVRPRGSRNLYFLAGRELLRLIHGDCSPVLLRTPSERQQAAQAARQRVAEM